MRRLRRAVVLLLLLTGLSIVALVLWSSVRGRPGDVPWAKLDLGDPVGLFTGRKIAALTDDARQCRALLGRAGIRFTALAPVRDGRCGYDDGVQFTSGGARRIGFSPARLGTSCPVAAGLALWEWTVVAPAAERHYGTRVTTIEHFGSYNCRRMYGRDTGNWSEHSTADAVDIAGFRFADGRRLTIARDWRGKAEDAAFLKEVRDGACRLFSTVLSPDYNAAHADHLHLDQAERGAMGWRACR